MKGISIEVKRSPINISVLSVSSLRILFVLLALSCLSIYGQTPDSNGPDVALSVVKIFSKVSTPDYTRPWIKPPPIEISGSGVVIEGKRILTNAHVVLDASDVKIQANPKAEKFTAKVEAIAPDIDLAVLKLEDERFFTTHPSLPRSNDNGSMPLAPDTKSNLLVYGFPSTGFGLSITKGTLSGIEFTHYTPALSGLRLQMDALVNPGNSGGPVVLNGKMIGIVFSRLDKAPRVTDSRVTDSSTGYVIPNEEIEFFLHSVAHGHYGKPGLFDDYENLKNLALRTFLKLDSSVHGVVVQKPYHDALLHKWDVITRIGDMSLDDEGMIFQKPGLSLYFTYQVQKIVKDGKVPLTILRDGKEMQLEVPVSSKPDFLIRDAETPSYFICGPMVFSTVTTPYINAITSGEYGTDIIRFLFDSSSPIITRRWDKVTFPDEELVVIASPFFPNSLADGYSNPIAHVVGKLNGVPVKNLKHLVALIRDSREDFLTFEMEESHSQDLIFPRKELLASTGKILRDNKVSNQGSPDSLAVWKAKPIQWRQ